MAIVSQLLFAAVLATAGFLFSRQVSKIRRNINLGRPTPPVGNAAQRWKNVLRIAIGQGKMAVRIIPGILHIFIYTGFLIINAEVLEIVIDGLFGTHRILGGMLGGMYDFITASAEIFMVLVLVATVGFLLRRGPGHIKRFTGVEMKTGNHRDAAIILWTEIFLITCLVTMNASELVLQQRGELAAYGSFPFSGLFVPLFQNFDSGMLHGLERIAWWLHILGILAFLNYIPYSKHFHIFTAFPHVYYSDTHVKPLGQFAINERVKKEVELILTGDPYATPAEPVADAPVEKFGAKDAPDLKWTDLLAAYTCTECGRCTSVCPANLTGKLLSPRKVMMDTRDRVEDIAKIIDAKGKFEGDGKSLLGDYLTKEEIWACTTCNACAEACPVNINPVSIITQLREYAVMEESAAPEQLNSMFNNLQNAGNPWPLSASDRFNWANDIEVPTKS